MHSVPRLWQARPLGKSGPSHRSLQSCYHGHGPHGHEHQLLISRLLFPCCSYGCQWTLIWGAWLLKSKLEDMHNVPLQQIIINAMTVQIRNETSSFKLR